MLTKALPAVVQNKKKPKCLWKREQLNQSNNAILQTSMLQLEEWKRSMCHNTRQDMLLSEKCKLKKERYSPISFQFFESHTKQSDCHLCVSIYLCMNAEEKKKTTPKAVMVILTINHNCAQEELNNRLCDLILTKLFSNIHIHRRKFGEYTKNKDTNKITSNPTSTAHPLEPFGKESGFYSGAQAYPSGYCCPSAHKGVWHHSTQKTS